MNDSAASREYPFDSCQMPLNVFDASFRSFEQRVLPELLRQQIAPIGMKSLCGTGDPVKRRAVSPQDALRYAMSLPVATTVSGIDSLKVLKQNARSQMERLRHRVASVGRRPLRALQDHGRTRRG